MYSVLTNPNESAIVNFERALFETPSSFQFAEDIQVRSLTFLIACENTSFSDLFNASISTHRVRIVAEFKS